ncbi:MAG: hypothetical protein AVDCRST_MAG05-3627, partial [uncultured Rubrobacteraceae bacterium]
EGAAGPRRDLAYGRCQEDDGSGTVDDRRLPGNFRVLVRSRLEEGEPAAHQRKRESGNPTSRATVRRL